MKKFLIGLVCGVFLFTSTGCFGNKTKTDTNEEQNEETQEDSNSSVTFDDQVIGDLTFEHFAIVKDSDNISIVYFDITNNTESSVDVGNIRFTLYTSGIEVTSLVESINKTLKPGETTSVIENYDVDLSNIESVEYTIE